MGGLCDQHDHGQVVEELERADRTLARLLAVRPGRLPQGVAQPRLELPARRADRAGSLATSARFIVHLVRLPRVTPPRQGLVPWRSPQNERPAVVVPVQRAAALGSWAVV